MLTNEMHSFLRRKNRDDIISEIKNLIDENQKLKVMNNLPTSETLIENKWLRSKTEDSMELLLKKWGF